MHYNSKTSFFDTGTTIGSFADLGTHQTSTSHMHTQSPDDVQRPTFTVAEVTLEQQKLMFSKHPGMVRDDSHKSMSCESGADGSETTSTSGSLSRKAVKKANLYAWLSIQTLPEVSGILVSLCGYAY